MFDMSISLKVVSEAQVFWDSFRRLEIDCLILFMGTRVSSLCPVISVGAFFAVTDFMSADLEGTGVDWGCLAAGVGVDFTSGVLTGSAAAF